MSKKNEETVAAEETTAVATKEEAGALMVANFDNEIGEGFEETTASSFAIPFLKILQSMSKQCKRSNPEYVDGAIEGEFFNTVSGEVFNGQKGLLFIQSHYRQKFLEWQGTVDEGGGLVAQHDVATGTQLLTKTVRDDDGNDRLPNNHIVQDVREHFGIIVHPSTGELMPVVISCASSQIKKSKKWMSQMGALKRKPLQPHPDACFSHVYLLTTVPEKKDQFDFFGLNVRHLGGIETPIEGLADPGSAYDAAKSFRAMVKAGVAQVVDQESEIPF